TQQMNSLRARGVMSFHASSAVVLAISALRRSAGSSWTTPPGTRWLLIPPTVPKPLLRRLKVHHGWGLVSSRNRGAEWPVRGQTYGDRGWRDAGGWTARTRNDGRRGERPVMDADVIIVGAGPTGLMLAGELCRAGVRPLVLERQQQPRDIPKAGGLSGQILEVLRYRGLLERFEAAGTAPAPALRLPFGGLHVDFTKLAEPPMRL